MKRYKRFRESFLESFGVDKISKEISKQYKKDSQLDFELTFEDFAFSLLYTCDIQGASSLDKDLRKFLSKYTEVYDEKFDDQDDKQLKEYAIILKDNFKKFDTNWKLFVTMSFTDTIFDIINEEEDCSLKDCEDIELIVLGKKLTSGSFITINFK